MTPNQIAMLLSVHVTGELGELMPRESQAYKETFHFLDDNNLIQEGLDDYSVTPKGLCLIEAMKALPMPVQSWRMPDV